MFKGHEPHEGTDQVCLGPRWVPGSQQTLHFSDSEMNGCGEGPDIFCLSEMPSEKVTSAGLKRALLQPGGEAAEVGGATETH